MGETGWLIERRRPDGLHEWMVLPREGLTLEQSVTPEWTQDHQKAWRFARKEDAEGLFWWRGGLLSDDCFVTEHEWVSDAETDRFLTLSTHAEAMAEAMEACLSQEQEDAKRKGYSDCSCINRSASSERAYEAGLCPHQKGNAALTAFRKDFPKGDK